MVTNGVNGWGLKASRRERPALWRRRAGVLVGVVVLVLAAPIAAVAAVGVFTSSTPAPAVSARNTSPNNGAKAVSGVAAANHGVTYGIYGMSASSQGYGVYSAGALGVKGPLVCSHCVMAGDVNPANFPTVPSAQNAATLGGNPASYYGRVQSFHLFDSPAIQQTSTPKLIGTYDGLDFGFDCTSSSVGAPVGSEILMRAGTPAATGWATLAGSSYGMPSGAVTQTNWIQLITKTAGISPDDGSISPAGGVGSAVYRNDATGAVITMTYALYVSGDGCDISGQVIGNG